MTIVSMSKPRRVGTLVGCAAVLGLGGVAAAMPASAATAPATHTSAAIVKPLASEGCSDNVCISLTTPSNGKVTVRIWAYDTTFYGEFKLTGPNALVETSPLNVNHAGGAGHSWTVNAVVGRYCGTAYAYVNDEWIDMGTACESVE